MRTLPFILALALPAAAQTPAPSPIKLRASLWALGASSSRDLPDGSLFMRPLDTRNGSLTLDGWQLGTDIDLGKGWSFKLTAIGGREGELLQSFAGETGHTGISEAMLIWSAGADTVRIGRMWTFMGMESCDLSATFVASHGLMATYPLPYGQLGVHWRHTFSPSWSTDLWVFNGEDRNTDNNQGKTVGANLSYNHGGAADKFLNLSVFSGPEQDAWGDTAVPGAEGRLRQRLSHGGQWTWGKVSLGWEYEWLKETLPSAAVTGAAGSTVDATQTGLGTWLKLQATDVWSAYLRAERLTDDKGFRLNFDSAVSAAHGLRTGADLTATALSLGTERKLGPAFLRLELRQDRLNKDVLDRDKKPFKDATSITFAVGASFGS